MFKLLQSGQWSVIRFALACGVLFAPWTVSHAFVDCTISRVLSESDEGEDVRCLQRYLNEAGYIIAESGPGAPGNETTQFRALTKAALVKWQEASNIAPATGAFGPQSQAAYLVAKVTALEGTRDQLVTGATVPSVVTPTGVVAGVSVTPPLRDPVTVALLDTLVRTVGDTLDALRDIEDAAEALELREDFDSSTESLLDLITALQSGDVTRVKDIAEEALEITSDVLDDAGGESIADRAEDLLDEVSDQYDALRAVFADAEDNDREVGDAEDLLDGAEDMLAEAKAALRARDYKTTINTSYDAQDLLDEAEAEIDFLSEKDIVRLINSLWNELEDVAEEIGDAEDDGEETATAEEYAADAKRELKRADAGLDVDDMSVALKRAEAAEDLLEEARDAIGEGDRADDLADELDDAWDEFEDIRDMIEEADDDGEDVRDAEELLDEAKELLNEAEDALDDEDYSEAEDLIEEALDLLKEAKDEL